MSKLLTNTTDLQEILQTLQNKATGTENLDAEISTQTTLIAQIQAAVDSLPEAGDGGSSSGSNETYTLELRGYDDNNLPADCVYYYSNGELCTYESDSIAITQITINNIDVNTLVIIPNHTAFNILNGSITQLNSVDIIFSSSEANSHVILEIF